MFAHTVDGHDVNILLLEQGGRNLELWDHWGCLDVIISREACGDRKFGRPPQQQQEYLHFVALRQSPSISWLIRIFLDTEELI
jgi:hypothetical protein